MIASCLVALGIGTLTAAPATAAPQWVWVGNRDYADSDQRNSQSFNMTGDGHHGYLIDEFRWSGSPRWSWVAYLAASNGHAGLTTTFHNVVGPAGDDLCQVKVAVRGIRRDINYRVEVHDDHHRITDITARADNIGEYDWAESTWFFHNGQTRYKINVEIDVRDGYADLRFDDLRLLCKKRGT